MTNNKLKLTYEELIWPRAQFNQVLWPNQIPVHPRVWKSDFAYTPEFLSQVISMVPESVRQDISVIEKMLGKPLNLKVKGDQIVDLNDSGFKLFYRWIWHEAKPNRKSVDVGFGGTNIALDIGNLPTIIDLDDFPSQSLEKLKQYAFETDPKLKAYAWYVHNYLDHGKMAELYLRNFAIVFNNLGLDRVNQQT